MEVAMRSVVRFSEDVVPLGDLKVNPGKVIRHADETGRPVLLTSRGRGVAVVQALSEFEAAQEEREFMRAVLSGLTDLEGGRELTLAEASRRLGLV
jgi:prevent-host-death family protein